MKIQGSVRALYEKQKPLVELLKRSVDDTLRSLKEERWHYESRTKSLESFAVKLETGRVPDPAALEDFLACMLVVPSSSALAVAEQLARDNFEVVARRPPDAKVTSKAAECFPFDDLRLYCRRGNDGTRPPEPLDEIVFEIQIKTFLQHAWGVATHDLTYKTDDVRWGKDRIVSHLKAAIEYAEVTIEQAETLSKSQLISKANKKTDTVAKIIGILRANWTADALPENLRGLAVTVSDIINATGISSEELSDLLDTEKAANGGELPLNLSPYGTIMQMLGKSHGDKLKEILKNPNQRLKILITPEISIPKEVLDSAKEGRVIRL
jgi:hypothetical protein